MNLNILVNIQFKMHVDKKLQQSVCIHLISTALTSSSVAAGQTALRAIHDWAKDHPKEILILAFSHFRGFDKKSEHMLHDHLIKFIKTLFGARLVPKSVQSACKKNKK